MRYPVSVLGAVMLAAGMVSCSDDEPREVNVTGTWYYGTYSTSGPYDYTSMALQASGAYNALHVTCAGPGSEESVDQELGFWGVNGKDIVLTGMDGTKKVYTLTDYSSSKMSLTCEGRNVEWYSTLSALGR